MRFKALQFLLMLFMTIPSYTLLAHTGWPYGRMLEWQNDQIAQVSTWGRVGGALHDGKKVWVHGKNCLEGGDLHFKVRGSYAFDIDEDVSLEVEFHLGVSVTKLHVLYNNANSDSEITEITLPGENRINRWYRQVIVLQRARFAKLGLGGSDFSLVPDDENVRFTVCKLSLHRSYATPIQKVFGWVDIDVLDEAGHQTPARMGIYDQTGRMPLPSDEALLFKDARIGMTRVIALQPGALLWPDKNLSAFYVDGHYYARLPAGHYDLVVAKGPEYHLSRQRFSVLPQKTNMIKVHLLRWAHMAQLRWYSGDDHMHYPRASEHDDYVLQMLQQAEDLNVANILQYGNSNDVYLSPYGWKPVILDSGEPYALIPGQEDPRTSILGHVTELNISGPIRDPTRYLLYDSVFKSTRYQGGLAGYAHAVGKSEEPLFDPRGVAMDVPFGLVDFLEIMMPGMMGTSTWFDFLNLGYKLPPTAGTDWGGQGTPGAVRNYVQIDGPFTPQSWISQLKNGRTFVTNGPMLEMSVNGYRMGSEIHVSSGESLIIDAKASINPDIDKLLSLELIEQGEVVKEISSHGGAAEMEFRHEVSAEHGTWFVLRAHGKNPDVIALSGPIYVLVDGQNFWKHSQVAFIVPQLKRKLRELWMSNRVEPNWEGQSPDRFAKDWNSQRAELKKRADRANVIYDDILRRAAK
jgi:hypothetical protein